MTVLTEEDLQHHVFQPDEAVLLCDRTHAEFAARHCNASVNLATAMALTADAHGTALRVGFKKLVAPYDLAGYEAFIGQDYDYYAGIASRWFGEMSMALTIEGINLAELDALYQYWLFEYAAYMAGIARALFGAFPDITRFFIPTGKTFLPGELFLDSDVAAAVLRYIGESLGRTVIPMVMKNRPLRFSAWTDRRPFMEQRPEVRRARGGEEGEPPRWRIGIVPAVMHRYERFASALRTVPAQITVFSTAWSREGGATSEGIEPPPPDWLATLDRTLEGYWRSFLARRGESSLPGYIALNPYLEPQFRYILTVRWRAYAQYIYMAAHYVAANPLDLFIYCDHFTAEGAIFAHLYRRMGARIALTPHSPQFNDTPYAPWRNTDTAIVTTGYAEFLARRCGFTDVRHVGYNAYAESPAEAARRREKPVVLFLANATEVQFPLLDIKAMLETLSVLARPPAHLAGKVEVAVRLKPGVFAEDPLIFETLCGLPERETREWMAVTLKQCLDAADCVVGIGLSTSGYLEVLDRGKPLVHAATAQGHPMCRYEFLPREIGWVTDKGDLWKEVEAVLFDQEHRDRLLAAQRAFSDRDKQPTCPGEGDPLAGVLRQILEERS